MAMSWTSWCKAAETETPPNASFASYSKGLRYVPRVIVTDKLARDNMYSLALSALDVALLERGFREQKQRHSPS